MAVESCELKLLTTDKLSGHYTVCAPRKAGWPSAVIFVVCLCET